MRKLIGVTASLAAAALLLSYSPAESEPFLVKPYLQLGDAPKLASPESLVLIWHTAVVSAEWKVEVQTSKDRAWRDAGAPWSTKVSAPKGLPAIAGKDGAKKDAPASPAIDPHLVYRASLT